MKKIVLAVLSLELILLGAVRAQAPAGAIVGVVIDPAGAVIPTARVVITNKETGLKRALATGAGGDYSAPALLVGVYEVTAEAPGFQRLLREAIIEAGRVGWSVPQLVDRLAQVGVFVALDTQTRKGF